MCSYWLSSMSLGSAHGQITENKANLDIFKLDKEYWRIHSNHTTPHNTTQHTTSQHNTTQLSFISQTTHHLTTPHHTIQHNTTFIHIPNHTTPHHFPKQNHFNVPWWWNMYQQAAKSEIQYDQICNVRHPCPYHYPGLGYLLLVYAKMILIHF